MIESLEIQVTRIDERSKRNEGRIKLLEENQETLHKLVTSVELIAKSQERIEGTVGELTGKVENLEQADGKKWRAVVEKVVTVIVAGIIGYMLAHVGF